MTMLRTEPSGWGSWGVRIFRGEEEITKLKISFFRSKGSFELDGEVFTVDPKGFFQRDCELKRGASVIARSQKSSLARRRFEIRAAGHRLGLVSRSWFGRKYVLTVGKDEVGTLQRTGFTGRTCSLEFPDHVPLFLQVFITYLVLTQAKREAAAASSGS